MLKFKLWMENIIDQLSAINSKDDLIFWYKNADMQARQELMNYFDSINKEYYGKRLGTNNPVLLYHGSPQEAIENQGFQITKGMRSRGFMGAPYEVQNHGIFMTGSKKMAHFFGSNRSKYGSDYKIYEAYCNIDRCLNVTSNLPSQIKKLGLDLINQYEGTKKNKLAEFDIWWLLDQPSFIDLIKNSGYNCIKFKEAYSIRKSIDKESYSYLIFDPSNILIKSLKNDVINDIDSMSSYIIKNKNK